MSTKSSVSDVYLMQYLKHPDTQELYKDKVIKASLEKKSIKEWAYATR